MDTKERLFQKLKEMNVAPTRDVFDLIWYVGMNNERHGPFTAREVEQAVLDHIGVRESRRMAHRV